MERKEWSWFSPKLNREMHVCRWGYFGKPILLFPTAGGDYLECERFLMIQVLQPLIEAGRIKVYSCGSISGDSWLNPSISPWNKSLLQARFDQYLVDELLPHIRRDCGDSPVKFLATGASLGAYNAVNTACKHPNWFDRVIAMSGTYDFKRWTGGHIDDNYYFNMPLHFLPNLHDSAILEPLQQIHFVLATGQGRAEAPHESVWLANVLRSKNIKVNLEIWGHDVPHDWPTWRTMLPLFLNRLV